MWVLLVVLVVIWLVCGLPIAFMYVFNDQIIDLLEALTENINTKTRILQEVNSQCNNQTL